MKKDISVIVPIYNGANYVDEFMRNITKQSIFKELQIIIVDDGSTDTTNIKIKEYVNRYPNQIQLITQKNEGVSSARNRGMEAVETKYFTFVDVDDAFHPKLVEKLYDLIEQTGADMVCGGVKKIAPNQKMDNENIGENFEKTQTLNSEASIKMLLMDPNQNSVYGKIYKTEKIGSIRFDERLAIAEDKLFVFQCMMHSTKIVSSSEQLYFYVQHPNSAMSYINARKKRGQDIVLDIIDDEIKNTYPRIYPLCSAVRANIHAGSYIKVYTNEKTYKEKCALYRKSVRSCPNRWIFTEISKSDFIKVMCVKYIPFIFFYKRLENRKHLL